LCFSSLSLTLFKEGNIPLAFRKRSYLYNCLESNKEGISHLAQLLSPEALKKFIERFLDSKKAENIVTIDLHGKSSIADYFVIVSGTSQRHVGSMAELLREELKKNGIKNIHIEGLPQADWVLVDAGDVIVHIFRPEVRSFYNLEKMWGLEISEHTPRASHF
jgi:ribosome-associated protein